MTFFTSDLHLGHANILALCNRPFSDIEEMDASLITNWNRKVGKKDVVYLVGDVVWDKKKVGFYMEQLQGKKVLITGNHDAAWVKREECQKYFETVVPYLELHVNGHPVTMCHYPLLEWNAGRREDGHRLGYLIHGHIHNRVADEYRQLFLQFNALNAGVDVNAFAPVTFEELLENNLQFKIAALQSEKDREFLMNGYRQG
jgi:calcineurin-like phosphoesterase family protein